MPVIINDFEVLVEPKPASGNSQPGEIQRETEATQAMTLHPEDIERVISRFVQRRERLRVD